MLEEIATTIVTYLIKNGYKKVIQNSSSDYIQELYTIADKTIAEYRKENSITETDKIPFYSAQTFLEQLLQFRFTKVFDLEAVKSAIEVDNRIITPSSEELKRFYEFFEKEIALSSKLKALNIDFDYKEEVFNVSAQLKTVKDILITSVNELKAEIHNLNPPGKLREEWDKQLDEILENLKVFKAVTAKERLENLEERIKKVSLPVDNILYARLYNLQSKCLDQINGTGIDIKQAQLLIKVHSLHPSDLEYKANAALAYFVLEEIEKSKELANKLLKADEFNTAGWALKCIYEGENFKLILETVPIFVRKQNGFKVILNNWLVHHKYIKTLKDFFTFQLDYTVDFTKKPSFSYKNFSYYHRLADFLLHLFFSQDFNIKSSLYYPEAGNDDKFMYAFKILEQSHDAIIGSEIEKNYARNFFLYHCCEFILSGNSEEVRFMETRFHQLSSNPLEETILLSQAYNSLNTNEDTFKAIQLINNLPEPPDFLLLLQATNYSYLGQSHEKTIFFSKFLKLSTKINRFFVLNFISFIRNLGVEITEALKKVVNEVLLLPAEKEAYKTLLRFFCFLQLQVGNYNENELNELLVKAENEIEITDTPLSIHIAFAYAITEQLEKAKSYLRKNLDSSKPTEWLKLYCKVLYKSEGDKIELLKILENWRFNFSLDFEILQIEYDLRTLQNNWDVATEIAVKAVEVFPKSEYFLNALFSSLYNAVNIEEIKKSSKLVTGKIFSEEMYAINISKALSRASLFEESLEMLYRHSVEKSNIDSRQAYLTLSIHYPEGLLKDYEEAESDSYVKYQINEENTTLHLTGANKEKYPYSLFMNRKVGDTIRFKEGITGIFKTATIVRITDKYLALLDEILEDTKNPLSGLNVYSFQFKDDTVEGMHQTFIENFGVKGSLEQERIQKEFEKYYSGLISYAEITNTVFKREFIDAYYSLTQQLNKPFKAISPSISPKHYPEHTSFVLDFTTLCLFNELETECSISFPSKFIISSLVKEQIFRNLEETKFTATPELSVTILSNKIIPHFYHPEFKQGRIQIFEKLLQWIDQNCTVQEVAEKLDFITNSRIREYLDLYMKILIDNRLLADRANHVLLTNDAFYYRFFRATPVNIVSPLCFLEQHFSERRKRYIEFMLSKNYVGIPLASENLNDNFFKMLSGKKDRFSICLENLRYNWNPDNRNSRAAIDFIKGLYIGTFISNQTRSQTTFTIFQNLIVGMPAEIIKSIMNVIQKEFRLLGTSLLEVTELFTLAVRRR